MYFKHFDLESTEAKQCKTITSVNSYPTHWLVNKK